jgi:hypothetical protein
MLHVPLERAQVLLHMNGEVDPLLSALEVDLYQRNAQNPALYVGYLRSGHPVVETFSDVQEGAKYVAELKQMKDGEIEHVVVDGLKSK